MEYTQESIHKIVENQRKFYNSGATMDVGWRKKQLKKLKAAVLKYEEEIEQALTQDLGRTKDEGFLCDVGSVLIEVNETIKGVRKWARPEIHSSGMLCFPSPSTKVYKMPYGVSLIISPFNFPFMLSLGVLAAAIAGGNTAVMKASSKSKASTEVLKKLISETFPPEYATVIDGGHEVADMCLAERFDKIFYTGSPKIGRHVLKAAAENLTPVALELGGETGNWAVIRKDANIKDAARKIAFFKILNSGQICINVNQIAVAEEVADKFVECLKKEYIRQIGENALENPEYPRLITPAVVSKCENDCEKYKDRIVFGGKGDKNTLRFQPTILYPVKIDEEIVQRELFSPLVSVVKYKDDEIDSLMNTIQLREHGLALYLFTRNIRWAEKTMQRYNYGGGCINEVCLHLMVKGVPFNGTGHSGMGAYHGEWGFREFTHPSTVLRGLLHFNLPLREHPYKNWKLACLKMFEK